MEKKQANMAKHHMTAENENVIKKIMTKSFVALCAVCMLLFVDGCGVMEDDFFAYAPKSHVITGGFEEEKYSGETVYGDRQSAAEENPGQNDAEVLAEDVETDPADLLVENVEYDESFETGIIRDMPFVYKGVRMSYDGDGDADFAVEEQEAVSRPVESTVERTVEVVESTPELQEEEEPPLNLGTVGFNGEFYEGRLKYNGDFFADIKIAYSEAGELDPGAFVEMVVPVETPVYYGDDDDDDDDDWQAPPAPVAIPLCGALSGNNGRTYAVVRNREGGLDLLQYSYNYKNANGENCYLRVIASFFGGASEGQAVGLLDRLEFKYVGEQTGL